MGSPMPATISGASRARVHENHSPNGAVLFAVYRKPNIYFHAAKETAGF